MNVLLRILVPSLLLGTTGIANAKPVVQLDRPGQMCTTFDSEDPMTRVVVVLPLEMVALRDNATVVLVLHHNEVRVSVGKLDLDSALRATFLDIAEDATQRCAKAQASSEDPDTDDNTHA